MSGALEGCRGSTTARRDVTRPTAGLSSDVIAPPSDQHRQNNNNPAPINVRPSLRLRWRGNHMSSYVIPKSDIVWLFDINGHMFVDGNIISAAAKINLN